MCTQLIITLILCEATPYYLDIIIAGSADQSRNGPGKSMVTNPIYAGPVYDMIDTRFESLTKSSSPQLSIPISPISPTSPLSDDSMGIDEYSHLTTIKSKQKSRNVYTLPGTIHAYLLTPLVKTIVAIDFSA